MLGAALSIFVAYMFRAVATNIICYKVLKLDIPIFVRKCYLRMSLASVIALVVGYATNQMLTGVNWKIFVIKGTIVTFVYLISIFIFGINSDERRSVINKLKTKFIRG